MPRSTFVKRRKHCVGWPGGNDNGKHPDRYVFFVARGATDAAGDFVTASKSAATRRAYQSDARDFSAWCSRHGVEPLPASVDTVAAYLAALATSGLKASTITRRCAAIGYTSRRGVGASNEQRGNQGRSFRYPAQHRHIR